MNKISTFALLLSLGALSFPTAQAQSQGSLPQATPPAVQAPTYNKRSQLYRLRQECQVQAQQQGLSPEQTTAYVQNCLQGKH